MSGLRRICRLYGGMTIQGVRWAWDYAREEPVRESEMPTGSKRWRESERAKYGAVTTATKPGLPGAQP